MAVSRPPSRLHHACSQEIQSMGRLHAPRPFGCSADSIRWLRSLWAQQRAALEAQTSASPHYSRSGSESAKAIPRGPEESPYDWLRGGGRSQPIGARQYSGSTDRAAVQPVLRHAEHGHGRLREQVLEHAAHARVAADRHRLRIHPHLPAAVSRSVARVWRSADGSTYRTAAMETSSAEYSKQCVMLSTAKQNRTNEWRLRRWSWGSRRAPADGRGSTRPIRARWTSAVRRTVAHCIASLGSDERNETAL